jgi:hypothetical protein
MIVEFTEHKAAVIEGSAIRINVFTADKRMRRMPPALHKLITHVLRANYPFLVLVAEMDSVDVPGFMKVQIVGGLEDPGSARLWKGPVDFLGKIGSPRLPANNQDLSPGRFARFDLFFV